MVLFDWTAGGHRPPYVRRFVQALEPLADVVLALPDVTLQEVRELGVETFSLGEPRPDIGSRLTRKDLLVREAALLRTAAARGDQALHLYADHVLVRLIREPEFPVSISLLLYYPRSHYRRAFGSRLGLRERVVAELKEGAVKVWRRRADAKALFALDEEAARRWSNAAGAPAFWLPEPPVGQLPDDDARERTGCVVWGALDERKGLDLLADALALRPLPIRLVVAGRPSDGYGPELEHQVARMRASGADVDLRAQSHSETDGLRALAEASCAVLPYRRHSGMSRVLVEACSVGTPVLVHDFGLMGHLVKTYGLGMAVDCFRPEKLRDALGALTEPSARRRYADHLAAFSARFTRERFQAALAAGLGLGAASVAPELATGGSAR